MNSEFIPLISHSAVSDHMLRGGVVSAMSVDCRVTALLANDMTYGDDE